LRWIKVDRSSIGRFAAVAEQTGDTVPETYVSLAKPGYQPVKAIRLKSTPQCTVVFTNRIS